jgi:predicted nucleic acid-binding protein
LILIDSCVLVDVIDADPIWSAWSGEQLDLWSSRGPLVINDIVYAELSMGFDTVDALDKFVDQAQLDMRRMPRDALFLAARAWQRYRRRGGTRHGMLPDFFIGAHAAVLGIPMLTRDPSRYRTEFRSLRLVTPDRNDR